MYHRYIPETILEVGQEEFRLVTLNLSVLYWLVIQIGV